MLDKRLVFETLETEMMSRIQRIQVQFDELQKSLTNETKSSAGDKHETGRAMAQLEQEKLSKSLTQMTQLRSALAKVNPDGKHTTIQYGSLVKSSKGYFFFSVGLGQIEVTNETVFCLTATSPMGQKLLGKIKGESIQMNGKVEILDLI